MLEVKVVEGGEPIIEIPVRLLKRIAKVDTDEESEDWLLTQDETFIKRMTKAREQDIKGEGFPLADLKKELGMK